MKKVFLAMALVGSTGQVLAMTGNQLLETARAGARLQAGQPHDRDVANAWLWIGFVDGASSTLQITDPKVCLPPNSTKGQYAGVVKQYLEQNPSQLHLPAEVLVREALQRAFPCR